MRDAVRTSHGRSSADPGALVLRPPTVDDAAEMWRLARETLDRNSPYAYLMLAEHFPATCAVARRCEDDALLGFVTGFRLPEDPSTLFVWQIAVGGAARGRGLAICLLDHVAARPAPPPLRYVEATVTPSNDASARTFRRFALTRGARCVETPLFETEHFPRDSAHEPEHRFRIGPF